MIYGYLHQGSGVGNQLHRYIATRIKAQQLNTDWRMIWNPDGSGKVGGFKCKEFMEFDDGKIIEGVYNFSSNLKEWNEKKVVENGVDIRGYDPEWNFIEDNTIIEGEFQDERYWEDLANHIDKWLKVEPIKISEDVCVIGFRGGEFTVFPDLFLQADYWEEGIERMLNINPKMRFEIHTDDPETARVLYKLVPQDRETRIIHDIGINWRSMRYADYAIIANSSFYILPRWLKHETSHGLTIAPRYWARRNTKTWALPQNYYNYFEYI